ncbi:hypothetical protein OE09_1580 [Flavobacteriaceae bacterium MAR_2010_72]|nr:hypothetical protein OE09_1580 [Flavobacteriaceae bacterium MAR_2010_72]
MKRITLTLCLSVVLLTQNGHAQATSQKPTETANAKPLRFVMHIGMTNLPGDKSNSNCYSNLMDRTAPTGWGDKGFARPGLMDEARAILEELKPKFIAACEKSGRKITHINNFSYTWNRYEGDEAQLLNTKARVPEDVTVKLD